ncbi:MAG: hypothetical protein NC548_34300 [Lachnospiraceae bacterium]|nr:hypothetical protein [Lachnospiraceae bacterium]
MEKTLWEVLNGKEEDHIIPFFWQNGEDEATIRNEMKQIYASGIRQVCVESRTHPDFLGESWWRDLDIILDEAEKRKMRVWVLDDAHFPSGYANGKVAENPRYGKKYLDCYHIDVKGPLKDNGFLIRTEDWEETVAVTAGKREPADHVFSEVLDVTEKVRDGILYWDVPKGNWTITVIKVTDRGTGRKNYINTIDTEAVEFFLRTVYEPHYLRYGAQFGREFAGFFSDEPELGNVLSEYGHNARLGIPGQTLPWSRELWEELKVRFEDSMAVCLTALWDDVGEKTSSARFFYMDAVTDLYGKCFCGQVGDWCREHGVEYIGHVIEDNGSHGRLGLGTGHFFKALWGQDMSGIDVVLQQIRPGFDDCYFYHTRGKGMYDGLFFHYGLAKMGVSLAHLDRKKKGRTMCEIFGAYGWTEGLKLMKWLADHMLVRGGNCFVPHAFSMKDFPDRDCPPHFYAHGKNPQFRYFSHLMAYMNRVSHLISNGRHIPSAAVFYPVCAEWMGECDGFEVPGSILMKLQADYEVLPEEALLRGKLEDGCLTAGDESYRTVIFPRCEYLPDEILQWCDRALCHGVKVVFHRAAPRYMSTHQYYRHEKMVVAEDLESWLIQEKTCELKVSQKVPHLRYYHYRHGEGDYFLFFNESVADRTDVEMVIPMRPGQTDIVEYDAWENRLYALPSESGKVSLSLLPGEATIYFAGKAYMDGAILPARRKDWVELISFTAVGDKNLYKVKMREYNGKSIREVTIEGLVNLTGADYFPYFSGEMEYEMTFDRDKLPADSREFLLDCGEVYETMEVFFNEKSCGVRLAAPYVVCFDESFLLPGENVIRIKVCNTLVHAVRDHLSATMPVEPSGLLGPVRLFG